MQYLQKFLIPNSNCNFWFLCLKFVVLPNLCIWIHCISHVEQCHGIVTNHPNAFEHNSDTDSFQFGRHIFRIRNIFLIIRHNYSKITLQLLLKSACITSTQYLCSKSDMQFSSDWLMWLLYVFQSLSASRPLVSVYSEKNQAIKDKTVALPAVFKAPIRPDVVNEIHQLMRRNNRQAYAVSDKAGKWFHRI